MDTAVAPLETKPSDSPRILLVRPSALGDVSRTVPCLTALRQRYPQATIDWLVATPFADAVRHHPALDDVVLFDRRGLGRFGRSWRATRQGLAFVRELRRRRYDMAFDFQGLLRSGLFTWLSGAKRRVGFANARENARIFYNEKHHVDAQLHTVDRMMQLLAAAEPQVSPQVDAEGLRLHLPPEHRDWLEALLAAQGLTGQDYVCLAPTAQWGCKCWPMASFAEVAGRLLRGDVEAGLPPVAQVFLLAAPQERTAVSQIYALLKDQGFTGEELEERLHFPATQVGQMMALISQCRLLICNDSAALHIAVGFGRPFVTIYGPTDPQQVGPYGDCTWVLQPQDIASQDMGHYRRHKDDNTLIARVPVERVWQAVVQRWRQA